MTSKEKQEDATPEIAQLQEKYIIGQVDWVAIDASGTEEQTLDRGKAGLVTSATFGS